jgi:hypothetical protein
MKSLTGLVPFSSYCARTGIVGKSKFKTRIDAVGESSVVKVEGSTVFSQPLLDLPSVTDGLCSLASARGLRVSQWNQMERLGSSILGVGYYDDVRDNQVHFLGSRGLFYFDSSAECQASMETIKVRWNHKVVPAVFACGVETSRGSRLNVAWWGKDTINSDIKGDILPQSFESMASCEVEGKKIADLLIGEGTKVLGYLCGYRRDVNDNESSELYLEIFTH